MKTAHCLSFAVIAVCLSLVTAPAHAFRGMNAAAGSDSAQISDQIVRLSLVEGDVRIARGKAAKHATGGDWGQAAANLPIQSGFSLATGTGRAEIELEDDSTVYLGENSVLVFDVLADEGETPHTVLTLVSGVATVHVHTAVPGATFLLTTPAAKVTVPYGTRAYLRVNSYLDATQITPQSVSGLDVDGKPLGNGSVGKTLTYYADHDLDASPFTDPSAFRAWDTWTAKRIAARAAALSAAMHDAGLTAPLPGLADLAEQGTFFACAPYGTCWQPNAGSPSRNSGGGVQPARFGMRSAWTRPHLVLAAQMYDPDYADPYLLLDDASFPCDPGGVTRFDRRLVPYGAGYSFGVAPYDWAECHAGSWIPRNNRYVWVVGTRKHHHCPVHWVKYGGKTAFVPIHPRDQRGELPVNLEHGVFQITDRSGKAARFVAFREGTPVKTLDAAPREFRAAYYPPLQRTQPPQLLAHALRTGPEQTAHGVIPAPRLTSSPILFDHRSQSFAVARTTEMGGRSSTVTERFCGDRAGGGGSRYAGGASSSSSAARGDSSSGGGRASSAGSSFSAGGASHGGGGSAGGASGGGHR